MMEGMRGFLSNQGGLPDNGALIQMGQMIYDTREFCFLFVRERVVPRCAIEGENGFNE